MLYSGDLGLVRRQSLDPFSPSDMWGAKRVANGREIFLRHESIPSRALEYQWLDAETFQLRYQTTGDTLQGRALKGDEDGAFFQGVCSGLCVTDANQRVHTICDVPLCRDRGVPELIGKNLLGISSFRGGFGIVHREHGLLWADTVDPKYNPKDFEFGPFRSALSGDRFAIWLTAFHKSFFDSVQVHNDPVILVYDTLNPHHIFSTKIHDSADFDFALSPDGRKLAVFQGSKVELYTFQ